MDIDERVPIPEKPLSSYNKTKGIAEGLVLEANGKNGLKTVSIRPSGIFGYVSRNGRHCVSWIHMTTETAIFKVWDQLLQKRSKAVKQKFKSDRIII